MQHFDVPPLAYIAIRAPKRRDIIDWESLAPPRRTPRNSPVRRRNPLRDLTAPKPRTSETDLSALVQDHVDAHIQKLESKLLKDFRELGERAVEESATVLTDQISGRLDSLEKVSAVQSETLLSLRDSSKIAAHKVGSAVDQIEKSIADAVPGFKLAPRNPVHPQFQVPPEMQIVRAEPHQIGQAIGAMGFCPSCTSTNVRRASRSGLMEEFLRLFFISPFRCRACRHKFYRF